MEVLNYLLPGVIFVIAGYFLYTRYKNVYQKGKCANCSSYKSCDKVYKVEIKDR